MIRRVTRRFKLRFAELDWIEGVGALTRFPDGSQWGAHPHEAPHYHAIAHRLGYEGDVLAYCQEHELAHHVVAEGFGSHSLVLWALAHGDKPTPMIAAAEESLTMNLQRFARTNENPFVDGADWNALRRRFLGLIDPRDEGDVE